MNIFERFQGVFASPKRTLEGVAAKPVWVDAFVILLIVLAVYSYLISPITQKESLAMFQSNPKFEERMGKEAYGRAIASMEHPNLVRTIGSGVLFSGIGFFIASVLLLLIGRFFSTTGTYKQVLSVVVHANFINNILGNAVRLVLIFVKKSVFQTSTSLVALFPKMTFGSPAYIILGQFDFFQIWMYGVMAFGLAAVFKVELKKALYVSFGFFLLKSLFNIAFGFLLRSMTGV